MSINLLRRTMDSVKVGAISIDIQAYFTNLENFFKFSPCGV